MEEIKKCMGTRLKKAREEAKITQQALADYIGLSRAAIAQWETGNTKNIRPENLFKAAEKLSKSAKWLALGEGPETPPEFFYEAISNLPPPQAQQSLDFINFQWMHTEGRVAAQKIASYTAMIDRIKKDMDRKKSGE